MDRNGQLTTDNYRGKHMQKARKTHFPTAAAGIASGTAYLAAMWVDNRLSSHPFNDLKLVGQVFTTKTPWWIIQGLVGHYAFSVMIAFIYAKIAYRSLPGPGVVKGIIFLNMENTVLYPGAFIADRVHAGIQEG